MKTLKGTLEVIVSPNLDYDPKKPWESKLDHFSFISKHNVEDGVLIGYFAEQGYVLVGQASVEIAFISAEQSIAGAVAAIDAQKKTVMAKAQNEVTKLEKKKQQLLAITN